MEKFMISINQIKKCKHALGLPRSKGSHRNYYNSGYEQDPELDELVEKQIMTRRELSKEMGGFYYHVTDKGILLFKEIFGNFKTIHK